MKPIETDRAKIWRGHNGVWSIDKARMFGLPCVGAEYTSETGDHYRMLSGARCAVCGCMAQHVHHEPNKGMGGHATLTLGGRVLRPTLFALCERCHNLRHFGSGENRLLIEWEWTLPVGMEQAWVDGYFFRELEFEPHDMRLYHYGKYVVSLGGKIKKSIAYLPYYERPYYPEFDYKG